MNVSSIYLGPYFHCKTAMVMRRDDCMSCPNADCSSHGYVCSSNHCYNCGSKIVKVSREVEQDAVNGWDVCGRIKEVLMFYHDCGEASHLFIPNITRDYPRSEFWVKDMDDGAREILPCIITSELIWLENQFKDAKLILSEAYGPGAVQACWGLVKVEN